MPSYAEERGYHTPAPADQKDWKAKAMAAEAKLKEKEKEPAKERKRRELEGEKVEILKNPCTSLCNHTNEIRGNPRVQPGT